MKCKNVVNGVYAMALILPYREKMSRIEKAGRKRFGRHWHKES